MVSPVPSTRTLSTGEGDESKFYAISVIMYVFPGVKYDAVTFPLIRSFFLKNIIAQMYSKANNNKSLSLTTIGPYDQGS